MVIEATCMDCGRTFRYNRIRAPKEPMKRLCEGCRCGNFVVLRGERRNV